MGLRLQGSPVRVLTAVEITGHQLSDLMRLALQKEFIIMDDISLSNVTIRTPNPKHWKHPPALNRDL
jgi:hypothetical protein